MKSPVNVFVLLIFFVLCSCSRDDNPAATNNPGDSTETPSGKKPVVVLAFEPEWGAIGTKVTIKGLNFDPDKKKNEVFFNNVKAEVVWYDSTNRPDYIVAKVPDGAMTGKITVIRGEFKDESLRDFIVTGNTVIPEIYRITPMAGRSGILDSVIGRHFGASIIDTRAFIGETEAEVISVNDSLIVFKVPCNVNPGLVKISVNGLKVNSGMMFNAWKFSLAWIEINDINVKLSDWNSILETITDKNLYVTYENKGTYYFSLNLGGGSYIGINLTPDYSKMTANATIDYYNYLGNDSQNNRSESSETVITLENLQFKQLNDNFYTAEAKGSLLADVLKDISYEYRKSPDYKGNYKALPFSENSMIRIALVMCNE